MGCTHSKLDDLPAVALCRDRCSFLDQAIHHRYAFADSHVAYLNSLKSVGLSLHRFFDRDLDAFVAEPPSPVLNLPPQRKGGGGDHNHHHPSVSTTKKEQLPQHHPPPASINHHNHHHSHSGSHLNFPSDDDSDDDDSDADSLHHHHHHHDDFTESHSPVHHYGHSEFVDSDDPYGGAAGGGRFMHMNYMRKHTTPSVSYQQRPMNSETVQMGDASSSYYSYNPYANNIPPNQNPSFYPPPYFNYPNFGGGIPGTAPQGMIPNYGGSYAAASTSKEPPPPPSPPRSSPWDFLNPFEPFEKYYPPQTPSRDSREVREEEGIPDLEEDDFHHQQEVVKEIHGNQKFVDVRSNKMGSKVAYSKEVVEDEDDDDDDDEDDKDDSSEVLYRARPSAAMETDPVEYEVHVVDKKVVGDEDEPGDVGNSTGFKAPGAFKGDSEVLREIQVQFERASDCGNELSKLLEVGKHPYNRKHATYQVSSKMLHSITTLSAVSSHPSASKHADLDKDDSSSIDAEGGLSSISRNLSSTLHKLYLWEKKLYEEVKIEEKMRILHEKKSRKLIHLDQKGAEAHKVDETRAVVRSLSTKIRIAIQVVDKISIKINTLRDEELWPQLNELIQGLISMWKNMLECHRIQCQAIAAAKRLDAIASHKHFSEAHVDATAQLGRDLVNWTLRFACWVNAQKGFIGALNNWLMKCLLYVPEETPDGIVPFSPGRIGAPPIFVICNQWSQSLERVSEKEVIDSMREFARNVLNLWEQDKLEIKQRLMANNEMEKKATNLEREDRKMQKEIQALDKRMLLVSGGDNSNALSGQVVYQSDTSRNSSSLQANLHHIFDAMERFVGRSLKVCEDLVQRIEEENLAQRSRK